MANGSVSHIKCSVIFIFDHLPSDLTHLSQFVSPAVPYDFKNYFVPTAT